MRRMRQSSIDLKDGRTSSPNLALWMFDVTKSRMIDIMPEEFFSDIAGLIAVTFLVSVVILLVLAILAERKMKPSGRRGQA